MVGVNRLTRSPDLDRGALGQDTFRSNTCRSKSSDKIVGFKKSQSSQDFGRPGVSGQK